MSEHLYDKLADDLTRSAARGDLRIGDKLPSIREASQSRRMSITTVKRAYQLLESRGVVEARPSSGYYVRHRAVAKKADPPEPCGELPEPGGDIGRFILETLKTIRCRKALPLASPYPEPGLLPWSRFRRYVTDVTREFAEWDAIDDLPPGRPELIRQIALHHLRGGLDVAQGDIVVTAGATEAIGLCLQAVAEPGDTIAIESPMFYVMRQAVERLRMRAIEVPTHVETGIDIDALAGLLKHQRIDACLTMPNFQNPTGSTMSDDAKRALVALAVAHDLPLIENGVYNELYFDAKPPTTLKSFDTQGIVLHCNSFSKTLSSATRVGWTLPGRYREKVESVKISSGLSTSATTQLALARYLARDSWQHHLRSTRQTLAQRMAIMRASIARFFPEGTTVSNPRGGFLLWVQLPAHVDSMQLYRVALEAGIAVAPGRFFSDRDLCKHWIRLNCSAPWTPEIEAAIKRLGGIVKRL